VTMRTLGRPPDRARDGRDPLIRRSGHIVQDRLSRSLCWGDIPHLSRLGRSFRRPGSRFGSNQTSCALMVLKRILDPRLIGLVVSRAPLAW
jgi:hypothetical protein